MVSSRCDEFLRFEAVQDEVVVPGFQFCKFRRSMLGNMVDVSSISFPPRLLCSRVKDK